jgi:5-methyltetrahydropteroyltriglutamate--homocysteine methyltransferase
MKRSNDRILTTHAGSLPRSDDLLERIRQRETGEGYDERAFRERVHEETRAAVARQAECGIDIASDGELGKPGFFEYVRSRVTGFSGLDTSVPARRDDPNFPGYWAWKQRYGATPPVLPGRPKCVKPLVWSGDEEVQGDIDRFRAAMDETEIAEGFIPSASIGIIAQRTTNEYYPTYEAYVEAIAEVMREEYRAITSSGLLLQIDAPEMAIDRNEREFVERPIEDFRSRVALWVEATNHALSGIPESQVRFHICWGNTEAPHARDIGLEDVVDLLLQVRAGAYSVEGSNPRHAHEWRVWERVKLPEGKVLIPGVIDSTTNFVEHPRLVADRIITYARLVGRENVVAGTDCGFGTRATTDMVYPPVAWAKLRTLVEGAEIASRELW